jgi:hypothetical protein
MRSFKFLFLSLLGFYMFAGSTNAQNVTITVNASKDKRAVSPYIYGANNWLDKSAQFYKDAGLTMARMNGGNNATKYNWRKKLSSHPDWYNNVYTNDWDKSAKTIATNLPSVQGMFAFQLLGRVASSNAHNFNDWGFNSSQWWNGVHQNLAGGGVPDTVKVFKDNQWQYVTKAKVEGNANLYTQEWPADSTVGILNYWFGTGGLGLNKNQFLYWNMDNEADIWNGTHDDVMKNGQIPAAQFMDKYIEVAKKAKALFPEIKICGPVTTSEWQWFIWGEERIRINGTYNSWFEYFIKRCAEEEKASGVRVLDVFDIHHYPWAPNETGALQNHRSFFDKTYVYPGANGVKTINGGWEESQNKVYIFQRINDWLNKHYGVGHGITLGLSEWSTGVNEPNLSSVVYASTLGVFANNGVEYFTPWSWDIGMWETLHLFTRYAKGFSVSSTSTLENTVSAYTTINDVADSMTVIIVNRDRTSAKNVTVNLSNYAATDGSYTTMQLSSLPAAETFKSHNNNALKRNSVQVKSNSFTITVPALSTTAVLLQPTPTGKAVSKNNTGEMTLFPNPANIQLSIMIDRSYYGNAQSLGGEKLVMTNCHGQTIAVENLKPGISDYTMNTSQLPAGLYFIRLGKDVQRFVIQH